MDITREKMTSLNTQFGDLSSHPLKITKNIFFGYGVKMVCNQKQIGKWENQPLGGKVEFSNDLGNCMSKKDCYKLQHHESLLSIHSETQNRIFWSWKMRKTTKNVKEKCIGSSSCVRDKKVWVNNGLGMHLGIYFPNNSKSHFPKMMACPNSNLTSIPFQSQSINYLN